MHMSGREDVMQAEEKIRCFFFLQCAGGFFIGLLILFNSLFLEEIFMVLYMCFKKANLHKGSGMLAVGKSVLCRDY